MGPLKEGQPLHAAVQAQIKGNLSVSQCQRAVLCPRALIPLFYACGTGMHRAAQDAGVPLNPMGLGALAHPWVGAAPATRSLLWEQT